MAENQDIQEQIRQAVEKTPVLLFMKGTPQMPQCGFSAHVIELLNSYGVPYESVDVLAEPALRQGVKEFADWPTVPQLYIGGEFVGGCDIVSEMHAQGELEPLLREATKADAPTA